MEKKKIGISTWFAYDNYGSVLQAFALQTAIERLGYDAEFINFSPKVLRPFKAAADVSLLKKIARKLPALFSKEKGVYSTAALTESYKAFRENHLHISPNIIGWNSLSQTNGNYDAFVCGSDQIWAPQLFDERYFLSFVRDDRKKVAYAPSFGAYAIKDEELRSSIGNLLNKFSHLSVREKQGAAIIKDLTGKEAEVVLDPTLLLSRREWLSFFDVPESKQKSGYVFCYFLGSYLKHRKEILSFAKANNLKVKLIPIKDSHRRLDESIGDVSPENFISLVEGASFVMTDSFHGVAFSLNFNIPFYAFHRFKKGDPNNQNSRIESILSLAQLESRWVDGIPSDDANLDFNEANGILETIRLASFSYLSSSLEEATSTADATPKNVVDPIVKCTSCGSCASVCPMKAITMELTPDGFYRPKVNDALCSSCGLCRKACPSLNEGNERLIKELPAIYSYKSPNMSTLKTSASGGIAFELGKDLLAKGYAVCGCTYDAAERKAKHILVKPENSDDLRLTQSSKYLQSDAAPAFRESLDYIRNGGKVAFFGTPCQIAGMRLASMRWPDRVLFVELICHGVPSYEMYWNYLEYVDSKKKTGQEPCVNFRSKEGSWRGGNISVSDGKHRYFSGWDKDDLFYFFFNKQTVFNDSCYECSFREKSMADIKIGDFWGPIYEKDATGVSMVLPMTSKGEAAFAAVEGEKTKYPVDLYISIQGTINPAKPLYYKTQLDAMRRRTPLPDIKKTFYPNEGKAYKLARKAYGLTKGVAKKLLRK